MSLPLQILITIFSGLLGSLITIFYQRHLDTLKMKRGVVEDLFAYKYQVSSPGNSISSQEKDSSNSHGFIEALNRIPIVFNKNKDVLEQYDKFYLEITAANRDSKKVDTELLNLFKCLCKASKLKCSDWNDDRFTRTFNV